MKFFKSVYIPSVAEAHWKGTNAVLDGPGILICAKIQDDAKAIVLLAEDAFSNNGASATNCAEILVQYVYKEFLQPNNVDLDKTVFIERDSDGNYDRIHPVIKRNCQMEIMWSPIKITHKTRTKEAVIDIYGDDAKELIGELAKAA